MILLKVLQGGAKFFRQNPRKEVKNRFVPSTRHWQKQQKKESMHPFLSGHGLLDKIMFRAVGILRFRSPLLHLCSTVIGLR